METYFDHRTTKRREEIYAEHIRQGYVWRANCRNEEADNFMRFYEKKGVEVLVHDIAIANNGQVWKDGKAILIKEKHSQKGEAE